MLICKIIFNEMNKRRYCVLWIPTTIYTSIHPIKIHNITDKQNPYNATIQDLDEDINHYDILTSDDSSPKVFIDITLLKPGKVIDGYLTDSYKRPSDNGLPLRNIYIDAKLEDGTVFDSLFLQCIDARRNGLFQYSYIIPEKYFDPNGKGKYLLNSNLNITNAIYHNIKSFFHIHEFHGVAKDSILHPYSSECITHLTQSDNPAILHYLEEFANVFMDEYTLIKELKKRHVDTYLKITEEIANLDYKKDLARYTELVKIKTHYLNHELMECVRQCKKTINMRTYYNTLLYSRYNTVYSILHPSIGTTNSKCHDNLFKKSVNVHNSIESIETLHKSISEFIFKEHLSLNQNYLKLVDYQIKTLNEQTEAIETLTEQSTKDSKALTLKTCVISISCSLIISLLFYILSLLSYSPKQDLDKIITSQNHIDSVLTEQQYKLEIIEKDNRNLIQTSKPHPSIPQKHY